MRIGLLLTALTALSGIHAVELPPSDHPFGLLATDERLDELGQDLEMPPASESGLVQTRNAGGGFMLIPLDPISAKFVEFAKESPGPILDIGPAYGASTIPALSNSSNYVIADDIGAENLVILRKRTEPQNRERLFLTTKRFPQDLGFPDGSLGSVLICRVFHFLRGEEIEQGLEKIHRWLVPGGKIFIVTSTQYQRNLIDFVPVYEERWASNNPWPGYVDNYGPTATSISHNLNPFLNVMDERPLRRALEKAGFTLEEVRFIDRRKTIPALSIDGREGIGVIAIKN